EKLRLQADVEVYFGPDPLWFMVSGCWKPAQLCHSAFARKYGLPCSACHIGWPILNVFGQQFRVNGYQLGNDKGSPIYQNPSYWPITFRVTPQWHLESQTKVQIDDPTGNSPGTEQTVTMHGFDLSGLDIWTAGTLYKNISFSVLPSMGEGDTFHFENAW